MSSQQATCVSFLVELLGGVHNFNADVFKLAIYYNTATMNSSTTTYSTTAEVTGTGYVAGGLALTNIAPATSGTTAFCDFEDITFNLTDTGVRYGLIYNSSKANRAVAILDFGIDRITTGTLKVTFPPAPTAIVQIQG